MNRRAAEIVAIVLACAIGLALDMLCAAALVSVVRDSHNGDGLQFGSAQVLLGWGSGIVSVLSAYIGYTFGKHTRPLDDPGPTE